MNTFTNNLYLYHTHTHKHTNTPYTVFLQDLQVDLQDALLLP